MGVNLDWRATLPSVAGNNWQTNGNGGSMRKRFRAGHVFQRGKRCKVWVGCYRERVTRWRSTQGPTAQGRAGSAFGDDQDSGEKRVARDPRRNERRTALPGTNHD